MNAGKRVGGRNPLVLNRRWKISGRGQNPGGDSLVESSCHGAIVSDHEAERQPPFENIYQEGEVSRQATVKAYLTVRKEGKRQLERYLEHYNPEAIIAVGYRVKSHRGTRLRKWATERLREYLVKGFILDDERLKEGRNLRTDYFDELLERIRDIRASEKRCYRVRVGINRQFLQRGDGWIVPSRLPVRRRENAALGGTATPQPGQTGAAGGISRPKQRSSGTQYYRAGGGSQRHGNSRSGRAAERVPHTRGEDHLHSQR